MDDRKSELVAKVPQVTFAFWIIKILATTLGETGGDAVTMSWLGETTAAAKGTGYLVGTAIFGVVFVAEITAGSSHSYLAAQMSFYFRDFNSSLLRGGLS